MKIRTFANIGCWLLVFPLVAASILHGVYVWHIWGKFYDGNSYSDTVVFILSYLTPIAGLGMSGLFFLRHRELAKTRSVALATALFMIFTSALFVFGVWFFHKMGGPPFCLSAQVWWLRPFRFLGI